VVKKLCDLLETLRHEVTLRHRVRLFETFGQKPARVIVYDARTTQPHESSSRSVLEWEVSDMWMPDEQHAPEVHAHGVSEHLGISKPWCTCSLSPLALLDC